MVNKRLTDLHEFAETTDLQEVVWEKGDLRVSFRRSGVPETPLAETGSASAHAAAASVPVEAAPAPAPGPMTIKSTMVGTFYRSDSTTRPPLVVEGTVVTNGQPVASIEAMKIMKDVMAPMSCKIVKALVANGHPVEYGQPLFEIVPVIENV